MVAYIRYFNAVDWMELELESIKAWTGWNEDQHTQGSLWEFESAVKSA